MFEISEVTTVEGFEALRDDWDQLLALNGPPDLQMSHRWLRLWWECYGARWEMLVLVVRRDGEVIGIAPLMSGRSDEGLRELTSLGRDNLDYWDFLIRVERPLVLELMFRHLFGRWSWDRMELAEVRADSPNLHRLAPIVETLGGRATATVITTCPYIAGEGGWAAYYAARSRKLRADIRRRTKKLQELGSIRFSRIQSECDELWSTLDAIRAVNRMHYAVRRLLNLDKNEAKIRYIRELVAFLSRTGAIDLATLWCGSRLIAYNLGYRCFGILNYWNTGFDPRLTEYSPGKLLLAALLESAFDDGATEINLLRGALPYKFEWTDRSRDNYSVEVVASATPASCLGSALGATRT